VARIVEEISVLITNHLAVGGNNARLLSENTPSIAQPLDELN
jgi:hypothetical protein